MRQALLFASVLAFSTSASADPLKALNVQEVRVALGAKPQRALGVRATPQKNGWRLQLRTPADGVAEVFDVTPGTPAITFTLRLVDGLVSFDLARFSGGHTYHVAVRSPDAKATATGLVYLYPDAPPQKQPATRGPTRVRFDEHEAPAASDEIAIEKKGSL